MPSKSTNLPPDTPQPPPSAATFPRARAALPRPALSRRQHGPLIWHRTAGNPFSLERPPLKPGDPGFPDDPWSFQGQPLALPVPLPIGGRRRGPTAATWVAILLVIGLVAALVGWPLVGRPSLHDAAMDGLGRGLAVASDRIATAPPPGDLVLAEAAVNGRLVAHAVDAAPLTLSAFNPEPGGVSLNVGYLGTRSTFSARPEVRGDRLVLVGARLDGPAELVLTDEEVAARLDAALVALFDRLDRRPVAVDLRHDRLIVTTVAA